MKILVISNYSEFHSTRPEAEIFIGLSKKGHEVHIITKVPTPFQDIFNRLGIKVYDAHPRKKYDNLAIAEIRKILRNEKYDILHMFNNLSILNGLIASKEIGVKKVIYRGAAQHMEWYNPINYLKFFNPSIDAVVCNSKEIKEIYDQNPFTKGIKTAFIPKGQRTKWYEDTKSINIHNDLDIDLKAMICVTVANNRKVKGIPILLKAIQMLPTHLNIHFLLIGDNMDTEENLSLIRDMTHPERIHILGFKPNAISYTKSADVLILPSLGSESLNKSVIEAMSLETPAIITNLPGNAPLITDGVDGFIVKVGDTKDLSDTIRKAYKLKSKLPEMGRKAKVKIDNNFSPTRTVEQYESFYTEILNDKSRS